MTANVTGPSESICSIKEKNRRVRRWGIGLLFLGLVVLGWVMSGYLVNTLFEGGKYRKPYLVTYINTGMFSFYLIPTIYNYGKKQLGLIKKTELNISDIPVPDYEPVPSNASTTKIENEFTTKELAILSSQFCILWFLSNFFTNSSLAFTNVSSATILSCTSSFFTLIIGAICKVEQFTMAKFLVLCLSLIGIILLTKADKSSIRAFSMLFPIHATTPLTEENWPVIGNLMALGGALFYGIYTTLLKLKVGDESRINIRMFLGFVGVFNIVLHAPVLVLFHYTGVEKFSMPPDSETWLVLFINALSTLISDFLWVLAMLMTSPLVVTVGLGATIPLTMAGDVLFKHHVSSFNYFFGAFLVCISFLFVNQYDENEEIVKINDETDTEG
ncbi:hypothetical protein NADFUDRAFT_69425 [Nadsonia fulvescens var. elongata DSM 6958]|uniref:EamA domain-containing protein n=1 Tax=Nadsonia fulvescens var. elongata DSM 6958 TaxID=857566 RepID=A0A1E3PRQ2_9ASCO|nr:hypothetical protein NADFUDRAFT_69425 [Nadsonia fulvescens var. elongata DSM 6958]